MATEEEIRNALGNLVADESRTPDPLGRADPLARVILESVADPEMLIELTVAEVLTLPEALHLVKGQLIATLQQVANTMEPASAADRDRGPGRGR